MLLLGGSRGRYVVLEQRSNSSDAMSRSSAARVTVRAEELQALREVGTLEQIEPREGDEAVRDELTGRPARARRRTSTRGSPTKELLTQKTSCPLRPLPHRRPPPHPPPR
ncbi:hypothetical protein ABZT34_30455 [Streptomyces sp. NPDC005329]|uniref:hypothetical protein n=1 Tax=Streptomyces sp. NPDC005329 TaxID=3157034 RepID=UPI0033BCEFF2